MHLIYILRKTSAKILIGRIYAKLFLVVAVVVAVADADATVASAVVALVNEMCIGQCYCTILVVFVVVVHMSTVRIVTFCYCFRLESGYDTLII